MDEDHFKKVFLPVADNDYEDKWATVSGYGVHDPTQYETKEEGEDFKALKTLVIATNECQRTRTYILTEGSLCTLSINEEGHTCYVS